MTHLTITSTSWVTFFCRLLNSLSFNFPVYKISGLTRCILNSDWTCGSALFSSQAYASNLWFPIQSVINRNIRKYFIFYPCSVLITMWCLCGSRTVGREVINKNLWVWRLGWERWGRYLRRVSYLRCVSVFVSFSSDAKGKVALSTIEI